MHLWLYTCDWKGSLRRFATSWIIFEAHFSTYGWLVAHTSICFPKKADNKIVFQMTPHSPHLDTALVGVKRDFSFTCMFLFKISQRRNGINCEDAFYIFLKRTGDYHALSESTNSFHTSHHTSIRMQWPLLLDWFWSLFWIWIIDLGGKGCISDNQLSEA